MYTVGDWDACGDRFYEKVELYHLGWDTPDMDNLRSIPRKSQTVAAYVLLEKLIQSATVAYCSIMAVISCFEGSLGPERVAQSLLSETSAK